MDRLHSHISIFLDMSKTSGRTFLKYALLQLPELIIVTLILFILMAWISIPLWLVILLILAWIAKDVAMYPFVWRAYDTSASNSQKVIGKTGTVEERLDPSGYIRVDSELWRAEIIQGKAAIEVGRKVKVRKADGLTLFVEPAEDDT